MVGMKGYNTFNLNHLFDGLKYDFNLRHQFYISVQLASLGENINPEKKSQRKENPIKLAVVKGI